MNRIDRGLTRSLAGTGQLPQRLYLLDCLRGVAALVVIVFHWPGVLREDLAAHVITDADLPFFGILRPVYRHGWRAVDLFFCLSGFIFFWLYSQKVQKGEISFRQFLLLRISRLYPLHVLTLLVIVAMQFTLDFPDLQKAFSGNSLPKFAAQLLMVSHWGLEHGESFNGPAWSISVEILMYMMFFVACRFGLVRNWQLLVLCGLGLFLLFATDENKVGRGLLYFFIGGLTWRVFQVIVRQKEPVRTVGVVAVTGAISAAAVLNAKFHYLVAPARFVSNLLPLESGTPSNEWLIMLTDVFVEMVLFPAILLSLAVIETRRPGTGARLSFLGDISYSSYLWHFPITLLTLAIALSLGFTRSVFLNPLLLLLYLSTVVLVSLVSYHSFERPTQRLLRSCWFASRKIESAKPCTVA